MIWQARLVMVSPGEFRLGRFGLGMVWQARRVKVSCVALCFAEVSWGMVS